MTRLVAVLSVLLLLAGCGGTTKRQAQQPTRLPAITLAALRGSDTPARLSDLRGPLVISLWANYCGPCRREMPIYQRFHTAHHDVKVLGIDYLDPNQDAARAFLKRYGVTYPNVADVGGRSMRIAALPKIVLLDAQGHIAYQAFVEIKSLGQLESLVRRHLKVAL